MNSDLPKVLHPVVGRPMLGHVLDRLAEVDVARTVVVIAPGDPAVAAFAAPHPTVIQDPPLGTGHAVLAARAALGEFDGRVLIVFGDTPLLSAATMRAMVGALARPAAPAVAVLGFRPDDPGAYGRLVTGPEGALEAIVEFRDADAHQRAIGLCNAGIMAVDGGRLFGLLERVGNDNAKGEYYLTDIIALAQGDGLGCAVVEAADADEVMGINSRAELARAEAVAQDRLRTAAMAAGVTMVDPGTVWLSFDTFLGRDVVIAPNVVFGTGVAVGDNVEIGAFCHIDGATISDGARVGPFARLRPGARIGPAAHIGNFVEVKEALIEAGAKVNHLSYIGDSRIGAGANIGAGTITCNYDGFLKSMTDIGAGAFIGSNTALVAPVRVGDGAIVGAGSVISQDVGADALALTRAAQKEHAGWAVKYRSRKRAQKDAAETGSEPGSQPEPEPESEPEPGKAG
jgi:bifunctional UDP-N-acetylglucosamine pyrophosphorylase/glucosamine-1-phosphate N-acetyltransferase